MKPKKLNLRKDALSDLASDELRAVAGAYKLVEILTGTTTDPGCSDGVCSIAAACCNSFTCGLELLTGRVCNL